MRSASFLAALLVATLLLNEAAGFGINCKPKSKTNVKAVPEWPRPMKENLKVAFFGDQGIKPDSSELLLRQLLERGVDFMIHAGDFDYESSPADWDEMLDRVLGPNYPYFATVGNHDNLRWAEYQENLIARLGRFNGTQFCTGEYGVNMVCNWEGLVFVLSGVGTRGSDHDEFIEETLSSVDAPWKVCNWHKNQRLYQTGGKINEVGWEAYEACRRVGAIVATGHEHSYARTYLMSDFENTVIASKDDPMVLEPGKSFVWVSGLAGKGIRDWKFGLNENPWWAVCAAEDNDANYGAVVCTFNVNGELNRADCDFIDIEGKVWDRYGVVSNLTANAVPDKKKLCTRFVELQVDRSEHDIFHSEGGRNVIYGPDLTLDDEDAAASLRFVIPKDVDMSKLLTAHLQLYGLTADEKDTKITITVPGSSRKVTWDHEDDDWEVLNVWVSPDLAGIVKGAQGFFDLHLSAKGGARTFASFDRDECLAPSLALEFQNC